MSAPFGMQPRRVSGQSTCCTVGSFLPSTRWSPNHWPVQRPDRRILTCAQFVLRYELAVFPYGPMRTGL